jgi:DNA polymerase III sliding clamp (beta) subunit (PCNA family)
LKAILDAKEFKRLIDNTKKFTRWEDGNNKMMQYIHVIIDAKSMEIKSEALDGHRISIEYGKLLDVDESFSCYISPKIPVIVKDARHAELELIDKKLLIRLGDFIVGCAQPEGEYYNMDEKLEEMQKESPIRTIGLNATYVKEAMEAAKNTADWQPVVEVDIREPNQPIIIRSGKLQDKPNLKVVLAVKINH